MTFPENARFYARKYYKTLLAAVLCVLGGVTYFLLESRSLASKSPFLFIVLYTDILLLLYVSYIVLKKAIGMFKLKRDKSSGGNKFRRQVITLFSCVTIIPSMCVFLFASVFFNIGIESLFKAPVKIAINNANQVSDIYINDMKQALENYAYGIGLRLQECMQGNVIEKTELEHVLNTETSGLGMDAVVMQITDEERNVIAKSPFTLSLQFESVPEGVNYLGDGDLLSWESNNSILAMEVLDSSTSLYLIVSRPVDQTIIDHKSKIKTAVHEYTTIATQRAGLKITFMMFFSAITILMLSFVILTGLIFANRIVKPVNKLITAAKNVSLGKYNSPIHADKFRNEFDILISSFNMMISKLEEQKKDIIISNRQNAWRDIARKIAHEIKNPLTPIQLSAERLKRKYKNEISTDPAVFETCIETIIRQVSCIGNLVKEFSDFARMPAPKMENTDIMKLIRETVFLQSTANKDIIFEISSKEESFFCYVDASQMNQVMINLLQNSVNAIKERDYQDKNEKIFEKIKVKFSIFDDMYKVTVEDTGPGFSGSALEHALDPYYTTRESGSGLGLAIVYKIVIEHGGSVDLKNSDDLGGACVSIQIPVCNQF